MSNRTHTVVAVLFVIFGLYMLRLQKVELQPGAEATNANRADVIVTRGTWADQSEYALNGLVSAVAPPLQTWITAISIDVFSPTLTSVRISTLLCSILCLFAVYELAKRLLSHNGTIMAMAVCGTTLSWVLAARQSQPDIWWVTALLFVIVAMARLRESNNKKSTLFSTVLLAVALAAALLSNYWIVLIAPICIVPLAISTPSNRRNILLGVICGAVVALPWYVQMLSLHGTDVFLALRLLYQQSEVASSGFQQLLYLTHPLCSCAVVFVFAALIDTSLIPKRTSQPLATLLLLLFVIGVLFVVVQQPNSLQSMAFLAPISSIIGLYSFEKVQRTNKPWLLLFILFVTLCASVWQGYVLLTNATIANTIVGALSLMAVVAMCLCIAFLCKKQAVRFSVQLLTPILYFALSVGGICSFRVVLGGSNIHVVQSKAGAAEIANVMEEESEIVKKFAYLYHTSNETLANEQLNWNLRGWMNGLRDRYSYKSFALPQNAISSPVVQEAKGASWVVYYSDGNIAHRKQVRTILGIEYSEEATTQNYTLYRLR